ncbi:metallo-sulfur cluster assembly [Aureococcus anophagefferens]|nr:metallo-sulfur cluster assembly [Aureococcus anophagefferens]
MHRAVLSVRGGDAAKLIHSLTTNNITAWMESATPGLAAAFLNNKGRVLADAVLWRDGAEDIFVDCPASAAKALLRHLKMYKLRSDDPLNCNLDALQYVAFDKGCYLGQELTARAKFRGEVRRRLMPVALQDAASAVLHNAARAAARGARARRAHRGRAPAAGAKLLAAGKAVGEVVATAA